MRNSYGRSSFGGRRDFGDRSRNDRKKEMYDAVCDQCGADCKVPFKPSSDKPVYCSDCYEQIESKRDERLGGREDREYGDYGDERSFRNESGRGDDRRSANRSSRSFGGRDRYSDRGSNRPKESHDGNTVSKAEFIQMKEHMSNISGKLDKLIRLLEPIIMHDNSGKNNKTKESKAYSHKDNSTIIISEKIIAEPKHVVSKSKNAKASKSTQTKKDTKFVKADSIKKVVKKTTAKKPVKNSSSVKKSSARK